MLRYAVMTNLHQNPYWSVLTQMQACPAVKQFLISKTGYLFISLQGR